jgi:hypothetical protein
LESSQSELSFEPSFARFCGGSALLHQIFAAMILGAMREVCDRWERKKEIRYPGNFVVTKILIQSQFLKYEFSGSTFPGQNMHPGITYPFQLSYAVWVAGLPVTAILFV